MQLFVDHSINMVHSCIAMLQVQTIQSKISGKIIKLVKNYKIIIFHNIILSLLKGSEPPSPDL